MERLRAKLHSKAGASMVLALLFLFFCLTVGAIILTAASSNAGRLRRNRLDQRNEMAVQSAAFLLRDTLENMQFKGQYLHTYTRVDTLEYQEPENPDEDPTPVPGTSESESYSRLPCLLSGSKLEDVSSLQTDLAELFYSREPALGAVAPGAVRYEIVITPRTAGLELPPVAAVLHVRTDADERYAVTAELSVQEDGSHPMTLYFGILDSGLSSHSETTTQNEPLGEGDFAGSKTITTVKTIYTQTVRWLTPETTKGARA